MVLPSGPGRVNEYLDCEKSQVQYHVMTIRAGSFGNNHVITRRLNPMGPKHKLREVRTTTFFSSCCNTILKIE